MKIKYVGTKPMKTDNVAGTGTIWMGHGDVQDVPDKLWPLFASHANVWQRADGVIDPALPQPGLAPVAEVKPTIRFGLEGEDGSTINLDAMEDGELKAFAARHSLKVDMRKKSDALRKAIVEAATDEPATTEE